MQILTKNNRKFGKPSRNPSYRTKVKILEKTNFLIAHQKNLVLRMLSHCENKCSNMEILAKIEGKESKVFSKIDQGHKRF
jgi:hypothetical protein